MDHNILKSIYHYETDKDNSKSRVCCVRYNFYYGISTEGLFSVQGHCRLHKQAAKSWKQYYTRTQLSQTDRALAAHTVCRGHL